MPTTGIRAGANTSDTRLSLVKETAWGTTPATPAFSNLRLTSENLQWAKQTVRSNEVRPDRNVTDEIMVGRSASGQIDFELSYGTFDDLLESLMFAEWATNSIKNGTGVGQAFTAERRIALPGGAFDYHRFNGLVVNTMSLNIAAGEVVTGNFGLMGKYGGRGNAVITGSTYADANQETVMNASNHFASLAVAGVGPVPLIRSINIEATNNLRDQRVVGSLDAAGIGTGRFEVTGSMECYFSSSSMIDAFLAHSDISLSFVLGTAANKKYRFTLPTIILTGEPGANTTGNDADVMLTLNFTAVLDRLTTPTPIGATLKIDRAVA